MDGNPAGNSRRRPSIGSEQGTCLPESARTAAEDRSVGKKLDVGSAGAPLSTSRSGVGRSQGAAAVAPELDMLLFNAGKEGIAAGQEFLPGSVAKVRRTVRVAA